MERVKEGETEIHLNQSVYLLPHENQRKGNKLIMQTLNFKCLPRAHRQ